MATRLPIRHEMCRRLDGKIDGRSWRGRLTTAGIQAVPARPPDAVVEHVPYRESVRMFAVRLPCGQAQVDRDYRGVLHWCLDGVELSVGEYLQRVGRVRIEQEQKLRLA